MPYVFSTATNDTVYRDYGDAAPGNRRPVVRELLIKGGANRPDDPKTLLTPSGIVTKISDSDAEWLKNHPSFIRHQKAGFMRLQANNQDAAKVASNMTAKDKSAPKTDSDFKKPPTTTSVAA